MKTLARIVTATAVAAAALGLGVGGASATTVGPLSVSAVPTADYTGIQVTITPPSQPYAGYGCSVTVQDAATKASLPPQSVIVYSAGPEVVTINPRTSETPGPNYLVTYNCNQVLFGSGSPVGTDSSNEGSPIAVSLTKPLPGLFNFGSS